MSFWSSHKSEILMSAIHTSLGIGTAVAGRRLLSGEQKVSFCETEVSSTMAFALVALLFCFVTGIFHAIRAYVMATMPNAEGQRLSVQLRFIEYAITATCMLYLVSISSGVRKVSEMVPVLCANVLVMLSGIYIMYLNARKECPGAWTITLMAWCVHTVAWSVVGTRFYRTLQAVRDMQSEQDQVEDPTNFPEELITAMFYLMVLLFSSFGAVQIYEVYTGRDGNAAYNVLSLVSKTTLIGLVVGGIFGRASAENDEA